MTWVITRVGLHNKCLISWVNMDINLFNFEIHNGIRVLSLYVKRISLDTQYDCSYSVSLKTFEQIIQLRVYATLAPLLGALSSSLEVKFGAILSWNPAEGTPKITFSVIKWGFLGVFAKTSRTLVRLFLKPSQ